MAGIHREAVRSDLIIPTSRLDHRCLVIVAGRTHRLERTMPEQVLIPTMWRDVIRDRRWSGPALPVTSSAKWLRPQLRQPTLSPAGSVIEPPVFYSLVRPAP